MGYMVVVFCVAGARRVLNSKDIEILSSKIGTKWTKVGQSIGVDPGILENIALEYPGNQRDMTRKMLQQWKAKYGNRATINYVIDALRSDKIRLYSVAAYLPPDDPEP